MSEELAVEVDQQPLSPNENLRSSSSLRPSKKPYKELNLAEKVELIRLAEENVGLSQATIAERYSIAKSNVCRILQRKREYLRAFESSGFAASRKRKLKCRSNEPLETGDRSIVRPSPSIIHAPIPIRPSDSASNETLRAHMYKEHEVSRMFMCRCCNWAFPDKTSLHVHIQSKEESKRCSLHSLPSLSNGLPSAFAPPHSSLNNSPLPVMPSLPFSTPSSLPASDLLARLQDRLLLSSLLTLPSPFSFPFLPPPSTLLPTNQDTSPSSDRKEEEEEEDEEIEVRDTEGEGETPAKKMHLDTSKSPVSRQSSLSEKRGDSPCETSGSSSSVFSPSHTDRLRSASPSDRQKEAFHSLNLDPSLSSSFAAHPHVSPSETHSSVSPQCESSSSSCFDCTLLRARSITQESKISFLESRLLSNQDEMSNTVNSLRMAESTVISLRSALLSCQEEALRFARCENAADSQAVMRFLNQILQSTIIR